MKKYIVNNEYFYLTSKKKCIDGIYMLKDQDGNCISDHHGHNVTAYTLFWANHLKAVYEREKNIKNIRIEKIEQ